MPYDYDLVVIGGGAAGLTAAGLGANFTAKTLLVAAGQLGGDCTWHGCIPSKTLIKAGRVAHQMRHAGRYGLTPVEPQLDFARVMAHVHTVREHVYDEADRPAIYEAMGVTVRQGRACFVGPHTVEIEQEGRVERVSSRYFVLATGSAPTVPPLEGLDTVPYLTNERLFELKELPRRLAVVGGGPIGVEMAQAFQRLGSQVTVIHGHSRLLPRDDPELTATLRGVLEREGVRFVMGARARQVTRTADGIRLEAETRGGPQSVDADALLIATGRTPNLRDLNLEAAGVRCGKRGIQVNDRCRTSAGHIYACGDVTGEYQFTHMAEHMAKVAVTHALLRLPLRLDRRHVPWCTFTDPELAQLGMTEADLRGQNRSFEVFRFPFSKIDRAITEGETEGQIKVFATRGGRILGVSILGAAAGEMIGEFALAMRNGVSLRAMSDTIHPYPTFNLGSRRAADQWYVRSQLPWLLKLIRRLFRYRGPLPDLSDRKRVV